MKENDRTRAREHLGEALDRVLAAFTLCGGIPEQDVPIESLDVALASNPAVRRARQEFHENLHALLAPNPGGDPQRAVLRMEESVNTLVAVSTDAAYRVGLRVSLGMPR